ncbi:MAG: cupredoxin domain-containing protein [Solirubrobacterales bacterium]
MRKFGLILAATAVLAAIAVSSVAATSPASAVEGAGAADAAVSGSGWVPVSSLSPKRRKAMNKALGKCGKIDRKSRRKACVKRVRKLYLKPAVPAVPDAPPVAEIDVRDKYFSPSLLDVKVEDSIIWIWNDINHDAHNVNLVTGPPGVQRIDFNTPSSPSVGFSFKRKFEVPGTYNFVCSIHHLMTMQVNVSK